MQSDDPCQPLGSTIVAANRIQRAAIRVVSMSLPIFSPKDALLSAPKGP